MTIILAVLAAFFLIMLVAVLAGERLAQHRTLDRIWGPPPPVRARHRHMRSRR